MATGDTTINTGGGSSVGDVQSGRDFIGRDQINFIVSLGQWEKIRRIWFKDQVHTSVNKAAEAQFQTFDWSKAEQAYLDKVIKLYDRVRILGNSVDVRLGNIFTQVYILDKPTSLQLYDIDELLKRGTDRLDFQRQAGQRIHGMTMVKDKQNLFILGKPGAGKTTFLKYITIQAARKQLSQVPIFVSLNQWADSQWGKGANAALLPFIIEQFAICDFPDAELFIGYLLKEGHALILFDGLDEVKQEKDQRRRLTHLLQAFAHKYDKSQYLITCRIAASDYAFSGFVHVEMADFTPGQVYEYARKWFSEQEKKFDAFTTELEKPENSGLAELCNTPLLLSLLCLTFDNNMRFPPSRAELYEDAIETLLRKWDSTREIQRDEIYRALSHKRKLQLLMGIAAPTFEKGELFFRQRDLEKWIVDYLAKLPGAPPADTLDSTAILKAIEAQHSILIERAHGIYSFSHLTFQEYLTARYSTENQGKGAVSKLIRSHLTDQRWREVFLLTASLLDDADDFIAIMRTTIDGLLVNIPSALPLLTWAYDRSKNVNVPIEQRYAVQLAYIYLALDLELVRSRDRPFARVSERALERPSERALVRARESALERVLDLDEPILSPNSLSYVLERTQALSSKTTAIVAVDYGLYYAWVYAKSFASNKLDIANKNWHADMGQYIRFVEGLSVLASEADLTSLAQQLATKPRQLLRTSQQDWHQYADALFNILRDERDLGREWNLSNKESNKLDHYFYTNELLVQCLNVAVVSDRQAALKGVLVPPQAEHGGV